MGTARKPQGKKGRMWRKMRCKHCGKELFDNVEGRFNCPFCGAEVFGRKRTAVDGHAEETPEERCQRLERELEQMKVKAEIEEQAANEHYLGWGATNLFSMFGRASARNALALGDIEGAKRHLKSATNAYNIGCIVKVAILITTFVLIALFGRR